MEAAGEFTLPVRWGITRAFWGLIAFVLMGGAIVTGLLPLFERGMCGHEATEFIIASVALASAAIFAMRKTPPLKRAGFWNETFRPFLTSVALFGAGATVTVMAREWSGLRGDDRFLVVAGLVVSALMLHFCTLPQSHKRRRQQAFVQIPDSSHAIGSAGAARDADPTADQKTSQDPSG